MKRDANKLGASLLPAIAFAAFVVAILAAPAAAQQSSGTLVFSLKFAGESLEVQAITLVPGAPPDYKVETQEDWLSVEFLGEGGKVRTIRVPDPRKQKLEAIGQNGGITGAYLSEENATLIFAAPNTPDASSAKITDQAGVKLLSIDYRKGIRFDAPSSETSVQPGAKEFEPAQNDRSYLPIAASLGAIALVLAYLATKK